MERPQAHFSSPAVEHEAENPRLRPARRHLQVEPAAIGMHAGLHRLLQGYSGQLPDPSRHSAPSHSITHKHKLDCRRPCKGRAETLPDRDYWKDPSLWDAKEQREPP